MANCAPPHASNLNTDTLNSYKGLSQMAAKIMQFKAAKLFSLGVCRRLTPTSNARVAQRQHSAHYTRKSCRNAAPDYRKLA